MDGAAEERTEKTEQALAAARVWEGKSQSFELTSHRGEDLALNRRFVSRVRLKLDLGQLATQVRPKPDCPSSSQPKPKQIWLLLIHTGQTHLLIPST